MIQYFYTLKYPEETAKPIDDSDPAPKPTLPDHIIDTESGANDPERIAQDAIDGLGGVVVDETENQGPTVQHSSHDQPELNAEQLFVKRELLLSSLDQDVLVYALADKYGIPDLKQKAARHFEKELESADLTFEIFSVIRGVYSMTVPQDRELRDIVIARIHDEVQY